jgi:uridine phosphorylase
MIPPSELILNSDGSIYHLNLLPEEIAHKVIFVGDPDRVPKVSKYFNLVTTKKQKREFVIHTGKLDGQRLSVISTGIGSGNIDIVWNELDALVNIDFQKREPKATKTQLKVLRMGTCGGLQPDVPIGTMALTAYGVGMDILMMYYQSKNAVSAELEALQNSLQNHFEKTFTPSPPPFYVGEAAHSIRNLIQKDFPEIFQGITCTAAGFYGPQGRYLERANLRWPNFPLDLQPFRHGDLRFLNMEMESSAILALASLFGHEASSLSMIIANRDKKEFASDPAQLERDLIQKGLEIMLKW